MSEILIISGSYFPNATANAVCVKKFEDALRAEGHHVFYCNRRRDLYQPDTYEVDGTELHTVGLNSDLFYQTVGDLEKLPLPNGMNGAFRASMTVFRSLMKLKNIGRSRAKLRSSAQEAYHRAYGERIAELVRERKVDLILSVSMPFHSHLAVLEAMKLLEPGERPAWIAYCIDAYWSKAGVAKADIPRMKAEEKSVFEACDRVLLLDTIEKDFKGDEYEPFKDKISSLPLPLFDPTDRTEYTDGIEKREGVKNIVFTGTIYDDFRNLDSCFHVIESFRGKPVYFHIMGKIYPKSLEKLNGLQQKMPEQIRFYGRMPYDFAKGSMQKADILLNLANDDAVMLPSKIFEYMMCCKPLLNLYRLEEDVGTAYLRRYPPSFHYRAGEAEEEQTAALLNWIESGDVPVVTTGDLEEIYRDITTAAVTGRFCALADDMMKKDDKESD